MNTALKFAQSALKCPHAVLALIAGVSIFSLGAALTAEVAFGLEPCILCIYQRFPFIAAALFAVIGFAWKQGRITMIALSSITFLINSGIALYHTGVEQKWWASAFGGCTVPNFGDSPQSILENILSAPTARCDEIPWADPILGLSMANYNVLLCFGMFVLCALSVYLLKKPQQH